MVTLTEMAFHMEREKLLARIEELEMALRWLLVVIDDLDDDEPKMQPGEYARWVEKVEAARAAMEGK